MATSSDVLLNEDNVPETINGDFHAGFSDNQHIGHLVLASKGNYLRTPRRGVGIRGFLNAPIRKTTISRLIRKEAIADGYSILSLNVERDGKINVRANRTTRD